MNYCKLFINYFPQHIANLNPYSPFVETWEKRRYVSHVARSRVFAICISPTHNLWSLFRHASSTHVPSATFTQPWDHLLSRIILLLLNYQTRPRIPRAQKLRTVGPNQSFHWALKKKSPFLFKEDVRQTYVLIILYTYF